MSDPVSNNYGLASWQDFTHNWRKADGDWLQTRSILRYATTAARDAIASPLPGMTIYNAETDRLEVRVAAAGGSWNGLYSVDGLIIEAIPPNVKMRHKDTVGSNGMVFSNNQIATQVPFLTGGGEVRMDNTGLSIKTGTLTSKLTTDATDLISSTRFKAPELYSTGALWVQTTTQLVGPVNTGGAVTVNGLLTANAYISLTHTPAAASHATRKDYVDAHLANRVYKYGDSMLGPLGIYASQENLLTLVANAGVANPYIGFWIGGGASRRGYLQSTADWFIISAENTTSGVYFAGTAGGAHITGSYGYFHGAHVGRTSYGYPGLWAGGEASAPYYRLMFYGSSTLLNAPYAVDIRSTNATLLSVSPDDIRGYNRIVNYYGCPTNNWWQTSFVGYDYTGTGGRLGLFFPGGWACQLRQGPGRGSLDSINGDASDYAALYCTFVYQTSALRFKKEVRTLRPRRILAATRHDPLSDEVALPDVMALRPVVYRAASEPVRWTIGANGQPDGNTVPEPHDTVWGHEYRRERLGLIADEVQHVLPSAVGHDRDGEPEAIAYDQIVIALLDHVQQLTERLELLEGKTSNGHVYVGNGHTAPVAA